jgi:hypothetical protein
MKKLTILLFSIFISFNSYGEELNSLFGITLNDNAEKYVSSDYIDANKYKDHETLRGYYGLIITDRIKKESPYASRYEITVDDYNKVHSIYGDDFFDNLTICQAVQKDLSSRLEEKYNIDFEYLEESYPDFKIYSNNHFNSSGDYLTLQCNEEYSAKSVKLQIMIRTSVLHDAVYEYYYSGL